MPRFSRCIVVLIFMQVFATVLADENRLKVEKHFEKTDSTPQSEMATNSDDSLQNIENEEPLGYPYTNYESTKKIVYNATQNITAFVEESEKPWSTVKGNRQGYIKSNGSSFKNNVEESELSHVTLSTDRIPDERLLTISRQEPIEDSTMQVHHEPETARIGPEREHVLNKFQMSFQMAGTQERNREQDMKNGQRGIQIKQGSMKGKQRMGTGEDSRKNGREKTRESERQNIEQRGRKVDRAGSDWRKNEIRNAERESALESIERSRKDEWENIEEERKVVEGSGEVERIGSEWNKGEKTDIGTMERNRERIDERVEEIRMGRWRKKGGEGIMIDSKGEMDRVEGELDKDEKNGFRTGQSDGKKTEKTTEIEGEWRKMINSTEEQKQTGGELSESSEFRILETNREKTVSDHRIEGKTSQYRTRYVGNEGQVDQRGGDETGYGRIRMVNEGQYVSAEEVTKPASESWEGMNGQDKTGQGWMEKMREGVRGVLDVHGKIQGEILERVKAGSQGIDREKGELWIQANIGRIQERLRKQGVNRVGTQRGRMVLGGLNERMVGEQRRMNRDRESEGMILRKQERKTGMPSSGGKKPGLRGWTGIRVGMNEYKERSGEEIINEQVVAESGIKERNPGWNKLLGVVDEGRDEY